MDADRLARPLMLIRGLLYIGLVALTAGAANLPNAKASGRANVNGGSLHYEVYGQGPPLVFLHAGLADSRMWNGQVNYFSRRHTVVRFDLRGYGQSDPPDRPYVPPEDLYALLQYLKIERACVVGLSIGGTIAIDLAVAHPNAVSALVVVAGSPAWLAYSDAMARRTTAIATAGRQNGPTAIVEGWLNDPMLRVARTQPRFARQMRTFLSENANGLLGLPFMRSPNIPLPNLSDLTMPVLVIVGDRDDPEIVERSRMLSREIPGARGVIIKGADHMVNIEKPREFNRALDGFLRGVKAEQ